MALPLSWDGAKNKNILWKTKVPLPGQSSPIVWGENVFLTGGDKQARQVYCFDRLAGRLKWTCTIRSRAFLAEDFEPYEDTGLAAPTPATDGERVYALFGSGELAAVDFSGKQVWSVWSGQPKSSYGLSASPFIHDGKLIVQIDQSSRKKGLSALYAIDPANGNTVWKTPRKVPSSWSSPILIKTPEREEIITSADPFVISYDPKSGQEIWRAEVLDSVEVAPSPIYANGFVYSVQEGAELAAIRAGGTGDVTKTHVAWTFDEGLPDCASPVTDGSLLVLAAAGYGAITCVDVKTGKAVWTQEFDDMFWSSPTLVGTRVYFPDVSGKTYIFELSRTYKALGTGVIGEDLYATPAFVDSRIYMRGKEHLYCIGVKGE
jgi:outer membrane protein assembly factor BamB